MKKKIAIIMVLVLVLALAALTTVFAAGAWADDFDSYPVGTDLHGEGGWKGWFNDPTFTAFTTDDQARSAPASVDIVSNADLVHEYTNTDGFWVYRAWQYIPTAFQGQSYFILLNQYDDAGASNNWSTQVTWDSATLTMLDTGASGASQAYLPGQWVEICIEIDLDQDTQAFYYNNAVFYTGTWSNHVSGGGITSIGAVDLFANGASSVYYDDMSLDPGAAGDCELTGPTPTSPAPTDTPVPTDTPPPTETLPAPTETPPAATETPPAATETPPAATETPIATGVDLSTFGGDTNMNVLPFVIGAILAVIALGWFVSNRREA